MSDVATRDAPTGEPRRIVIADDHEPTRVLLRTLIELEGMQVVGEARDGNEAVALALERGPDVVLLDVNMPKLDGLGAAEMIRARRPRIRLLIHTGEPLETAVDRAAALQLPLADKRDLHLTIRQLARQIEVSPGDDGAEVVEGDRAGAALGGEGIPAMPELLVEVNGRARELGDADVSGDGWGFVCECGTPGCEEVVSPSPRAYEVVRVGGAPICSAATRARAKELRDDSAALRGEARHQARRARRAVEAAGARIALVCARCGFGAAIERAPERCPMCASADWRPAGGRNRPLSES